ncbi:MAG: pyridoxal-dependent decarboxylase [Phycisphaerales bacterium]
MPGAAPEPTAPVHGHESSIPAPQPFDFRKHGHAMVDWIADYLDRVERFPVQSTVAPGWVRSQLPAHPPEHGEPWDRIAADVDRVILPGITHWQSPNFFGYFPANSSGPAILGELLSAGLGVQGMLWSTSPACTELEAHVMDWLAGMLGLPAHFHSGGPGGGVIQDTASSATLCALIAARERATGFAGTRDGLQAPGSPRLVAYATADAHSSIEKDVRIAGLGAANLRTVPMRADRAMDPAALARMMDEDRAAGRVPFFCVAAVGTTGTHAVDPLPELGPACARHGAWLHVDAAHLGIAALCPEFRDIHAGLEHADSYCVNPHKWMLVNFDCDAFWVRDRAALVQALSVLPEYLRNSATESGKVIDYRDWQVPLGRRFRALKLWFVIRHEGTEGLRALVRRHVALAARLRARVAEDPALELVHPTPWSLVCFRARAGDDATARIQSRVNDGGRAFITHTRVDGHLVLRVSIGAPTVAERHVDALWDLIRGAR